MNTYIYVRVCVCLFVYIRIHYIVFYGCINQNTDVCICAYIYSYDKLW